MFKKGGGIKEVFRVLSLFQERKRKKKLRAKVLARNRRSAHFEAQKNGKMSSRDMRLRAFHINGD